MYKKLLELFKKKKKVDITLVDTLKLGVLVGKSIIQFSKITGFNDFKYVCLRKGVVDSREYIGAMTFSTSKVLDFETFKMEVRKLSETLVQQKLDITLFLYSKFEPSHISKNLAFCGFDPLSMTDSNFQSGSSEHTILIHSRDYFKFANQNS